MRCCLLWCMSRRDFIILVGGGASWPLAATAQQGERMRRIGVLMSTAADHPEGQARITALLQGLQQLGWTDHRNVRIDVRWTAGDAERLRKYAAELATLAPDVIVTGGASYVAALQQATRTVPIVFAFATDPVGGGLVASLARPGGNVTGFTLFEYGSSAKWLEVLKQIAPRLTRVCGHSRSQLADRDRPAGGNPVRGAVVRSGVEPRRGAQRCRARTCGRGICARPERRPDRPSESVGDGPSRADHHACGPARIAYGLLRPPFCHRRRPDFVWA